QNKFAEEREQMSQVIGSASDAKQTFAVADLALMIRDLDSADQAYNKCLAMPGSQERARRGLAAVARAREAAKQDLTLAQDLSRRTQLASAIDKYHSAIFANPKLADSRKALAETLERVKPQRASDLREAILQYQAFLDLAPGFPAKERERLLKQMKR